VATIELAPEVANDLEGIVEHLDCHDSHDANDAPARIDGIIQAIANLEYNPLIRRPATPGCAN